MQGNACRFVFDIGAAITMLLNVLLREQRPTKNKGNWQILDFLQRAVQSNTYSMEDVLLSKSRLANFMAATADLSIASTIGCENVGCFRP